MFAKLSDASFQPFAHHNLVTLSTPRLWLVLLLARFVEAYWGELLFVKLVRKMVAYEGSSHVTVLCALYNATPLARTQSCHVPSSPACSRPPNVRFSGGTAKSLTEADGLPAYLMTDRRLRAVRSNSLLYGFVEKRTTHQSLTDVNFPTTRCKPSL